MEKTPKLDRADFKIPIDNSVLAELRRRVGEYGKRSALAVDCGTTAGDLTNFLQGKRDLPAHVLANLAATVQFHSSKLLVYGEFSHCERLLQDLSATDLSSKRGVGLRRASDASQAAIVPCREAW